MTGPERLLRALDPLVAIRARAGPVTVAPIAAGVLPQAETGADTLIVEDPAQPALCGRPEAPPVAAPDGAVVGWLRADAAGLTRHATLAVALDARAGERALVLLGPREARYRALLDRVAAEAGAAAFRWSAERIRPEPMLAALRAGVTAALHVGHGAEGGWHSYHGVGAATLLGGRAWAADEAIAVLLSLSCATAGGEGGGFAGQVVAAGIAGAALAPRGAVLHAVHAWIALRLAADVAAGAATLGTLLRGAAGAELAAAGHVIHGDPATPLAGVAGAARRCRAVFAPAADDPLPVRA